MWVIENLDDAGEGMFVCDAPNRKAALRIHRRKNKGLKVTSCEQIKWVDLALVTGELGESYYSKRKLITGQIEAISTGIRGSLHCPFCPRIHRNVVARRGLIISCPCGATIKSHRAKP